MSNQERDTAFDYTVARCTMMHVLFQIGVMYVVFAFTAGFKGHCHSAELTVFFHFHIPFYFNRLSSHSHTINNLSNHKKNYNNKELTMYTE